MQDNQLDPRKVTLKERKYIIISRNRLKVLASLFKIVSIEHLGKALRFSTRAKAENFMKSHTYYFKGFMEKLGDTEVVPIMITYEVEE